jgi:hypothetical protein
MGSKDPICATLLGNAASREKAREIACVSQNCPYVALYVAADRLVVGVFALPASKRWWIEYPQEHPEVLGLEKVVVHVTERIEASSPWTRGTVEPILAVAPCGTDCGQCPHYGARCQGCPATTYYMQG